MSINIVKQDITNMNVDIIVNAANEHLLQGGGVCGAIFHKAGSDELSKACSNIGFCRTGDAVITKAFNLNSSYIIHAVGPIWNGGNNNESVLLYNAYKNSLVLAKNHNCHTIAFPLISSGIYGYPKDLAWNVAIKSCSDFLKKTNYNIDIIFAVLDENLKEIGDNILINFKE